jgi:hypothetical protein
VRWKPSCLATDTASSDSSVTPYFSSLDSHTEKKG